MITVPCAAWAARLDPTPSGSPEPPWKFKAKDEQHLPAVWSRLQATLAGVQPAESTRAIDSSGQQAGAAAAAAEGGRGDFT